MMQKGKVNAAEASWVSLTLSLVTALARRL